MSSLANWCQFSIGGGLATRPCDAVCVYVYTIHVRVSACNCCSVLPAQLPIFVCIDYTLVLLETYSTKGLFVDNAIAY